MQKRAKRAGVNNLEIKHIESSKTIKRLENSADRLLLDVPCSGLGVLKRNPDAKWKLSPEFIENVKELQQHILQDYCNMLKKDGLMVYSTCSILPSENERQVEKFLERNGDKFELVDQKIFGRQKDLMDFTWPLSAKNNRDPGQHAVALKFTISIPLIFNLIDVTEFQSFCRLLLTAFSLQLTAQDLKAYEQDLPGSTIKFKMVPIPAGTFYHR